jgi:hypothetical protein
MMTEGLFLFNDVGSPKRLAPAEFKTEKEFQQLLARFPELLTDADFGEGSPRKWLLVTREAMVPDKAEGSARWSLDHLFLDQDGVPTLVEIKRASDTRARREVAAQMLDYAANATNWWTEKKIAEWLEARCRSEGLDAEAELREHLGLSDAELASYWGRVKANLGSRTVRLIFVADKIERELAAIVEFLNEQMRTVTVVAVELSLFSNGNERILSPRLIGLTANAVDQKTAGGAQNLSAEDWLASVADRSTIDTSRKFADLMTKLGAVCRPTRGSIAFDFDIGGKLIAPTYLRANGKAAISLYNLAKFAPFADEASRRGLCERLTSAGFNLSSFSLNGEPAFQLPSVGEAKQWGSLREFLTEILASLRSPESRPNT